MSKSQGMDTGSPERMQPLCELQSPVGIMPVLHTLLPKALGEIGLWSNFPGVTKRQRHDSSSQNRSAKLDSSHCYIA